MASSFYLEQFLSRTVFRCILWFSLKLQVSQSEAVCETWIEGCDLSYPIDCENKIYGSTFE